MISRKALLAVALGAALVFAFTLSAAAQQPRKVPRIGYLGLAGSKQQLPSREAFRQGLRDLGYVEGKNIFLEFRYAEGDRSRVPSLVGELVQLNVDVILSTSPVAIQAAKEATRTIPIVMVITADPLRPGWLRAWHGQVVTLPD